MKLSWLPGWVSSLLVIFLASTAQSEILAMPRSFSEKLTQRAEGGVPWSRI